jgi:hypothetical protein
MPSPAASPATADSTLEKKSSRAPFPGGNQVRLNRNGGKAIANAIPAGS